MAKYSKRVVSEICGYIEEGLYQKDAALLSGISESTFYEWQNSKSEFSESIERALASYKLTLLKSINKCTPKNGRLALEVLSRRFPHQYGLEAREAKVEEKHYVEADTDTVRSYAKNLLALTRKTKEKKVQVPA